MSQSSLDDDELFGEAAEEMRADVEEHLDAAREQLPAADDVWTVDADNTLGVLNALRSALDTGDVEEHLRDAKKAFVVGERADAFEDADDLEAEIEAVEGVLGDLETAREQVGELASTIPELRSALEDAHEGGEDEAESADDDENEEDEA
ncbi:DUF5790 family protein [Halobacterium sp. R2-5]|uniref:DUF5790 family protein n=1 Tax=Halobacterium sp. R2-5 TaxID=2715751 RepID=UPI00141DB19E|nr:DUF5790 family protein [Halobacterium sp. R2-5]NIB98503.1 hypothetical protein [Halobacterium sp. R2-5]